MHYRDNIKHYTDTLNVHFRAKNRIFVITDFISLVLLHREASDHCFITSVTHVFVINVIIGPTDGKRIIRFINYICLSKIVNDYFQSRTCVRYPNQFQSRRASIRIINYNGSLTMLRVEAFITLTSIIKRYLRSFLFRLHFEKLSMSKKMARPIFAESQFIFTCINLIVKEQFSI